MLCNNLSHISMNFNEGGTMLHSQDQVFDLLADHVRANPHPVLAQMREEAPVYHSQHIEQAEYPWILTRYEDVLLLLDEHTLFTKDPYKRPVPEGFVPDVNMEMMAINRHMLTVDPPDHTRLRGLVHKAFTPKMIREFEGRVQQIADNLLDAMQGKDQVDLINEYAIPVPLTVIAELLGVPSSDQADFRRWSQTILTELAREGGDMEATAAAALEFIMYFHSLFEERRANPREDLISGLVQVEEDGDKLDPQELISMVFLLLAAGHETTVNLIGNGTLALLNHPDQLALLKAKPELIDTAVEELLRFDGPIGVSSVRWAMEDITLHGVTIPKGGMVLGSLLSANRDPRIFNEPDKLDITREPNKHIAFGHGIHYCLGAPLARMEGAIAIQSLLRRYPNLSLAADPSTIKWTNTLLLHGMKSMPVRL